MTTFLDSSALFTFKYTEAKKYEDDIWDFQQLIFDYSAGKINEHYWRAKKLIKKNTTLTSQKWCDGLALIFHARQNCNSKRTEYIPTTVFSDTANTTIIYSGKREKVRIESMPTPVRCWYFDGVANWKGIYGLSGRFRGWFSDDLSRVPILAKMNVYVGDVVIQLVKWKKAGWKPPG